MTLPSPRSAIFQRFDEAIRALFELVPLTKDEWTALEDDARQRAFTVANLAQLEMVRHVQDSIARAVEDGRSFEEWKKEIGPSLAAAWGEAVARGAQPHRLETIFRTNVQTAYAAGRHKMATDPAVLAVRSYWMFDAVTDGRTSPICRHLDGTILPADDPFWSSHSPPLHHMCRSGIITLRPSQAKARGITTKVPDIAAADGFGRAPALTDDIEPDPANYGPALFAEYQRKATE